MIIPPISLYKDYWPGIDETMPEVAAILNAVQKLVAIGEKNRLDLISKRNTVSRLQIQAAALQMKIDNLERLMSADAEIVDVWCIDYTLEIPVGTTIGTMETPGEATRLNIQRGYEEDDDTGFATALYNDVRDGIMQPVYASSLSGAAWFFNAAMKAAWQKWFPLFRYGKIVDMVDQEDGTRNATVALCPSTEASTILSGVHGLLSSGDINYIADPTGLKINQEDILYDVPFRYMNCDDVAFTVDDDVIIEFRELDIKQYKKGLVDKQIRIMDNHVSSVKTIKALDWVENGLGAARDWSQPVIVGFQHDPQPCDIMFLFYLIKDNDSENVRYGEEVIVDADYFTDHDAEGNLPTIYIYEATGYYGQLTPLTFEYIKGPSTESSYWKATLSRKDTVVVSDTVKEGKDMIGEPWLMPEGVYITVADIPDCNGKSLFDYALFYCALYNFDDSENIPVLVRTKEDGFVPTWMYPWPYLEGYFPNYPGGGWVYSDPAHIGVKTAIYEYAVDHTIHNIKIPGDYHYYFRVWYDSDEGGNGVRWQDLMYYQEGSLKFLIWFYNQAAVLVCGTVTVYKEDIDSNGYIDVRIKATDALHTGHNYVFTRPGEFKGFWIGISGHGTTIRPDYETYSNEERWMCKTLTVQYPHIYKDYGGSDWYKAKDLLLPGKYDIHIPYFAYRNSLIPEAGIADCFDSPGGGMFNVSRPDEYYHEAGDVFTSGNLNKRYIVTSVPVTLRTFRQTATVQVAVKKYNVTPPTKPCPMDVTPPIDNDIGGGGCPSSPDRGDPYCINVRGVENEPLIHYIASYGLDVFFGPSYYSGQRDSGWVNEEFTINHVAHRFTLEGEVINVAPDTLDLSCIHHYYCYYYSIEGRWYTASSTRTEAHEANQVRAMAIRYYHEIIGVPGIVD